MSDHDLTAVPGQTDATRAGTTSAADGTGSAPPGPMIVFDRVSISFNGRPVLEDVSFSVARGQTLCILGRSGVGKSVTLKLIMGFLKPDQGRIIAAGQDITDWTEAQLTEIHKKITMVFQSGALFDSLSVGENVAFPLRDRADLSEEQIQLLVDGYLDMLEVKRYRDELPAGLSTGMKRAVAIARALASEPAAILYDEPTTMVDSLIARRLGGLIQRLKHQLGFTSIVVTHDTRFASHLADTVLFLHKGRALFFGPLKDFLASKDPDIHRFLTLDAYLLPSE